MNALDLIAQQVRAHPDRPAVSSRGREWGFRELWMATGVFGANLVAQGVAKGDVVALSRLSQSRELIAILALARLGAVSVSAPASLAAADRARFASELRVTHWVRGERDAASPAGVKGISIADLEQPVPEGTRAPALVRGLADQVWRIALSSGTTGQRKPVPWTHRQRLNSQRHSIGAYPVGPGERMLVCADIGIAYALGHTLTQLSSGGSVILFDPASPAECLRLLREAKPTRIVITTAIAFSVVDALRKESATALPNSLLSVNVSGSLVSPSLLKSLEELVCPHVSIAYGATELGSIARADPHYRLQFPQGMGRLLPWVEAQAVDEEGRELPAGEVGLLRFRARGVVEDWFAPGDRGAVHPGHHFTLVGRADDRINVGGRKVDPGPLEAAINALPGVRECVALGIEAEDGRPMLALAVVADTMPETQVLQRVVRDVAGPLRSVAVQVPALLKNPAGKVMRKEIAARLMKALAKR